MTKLSRTAALKNARAPFGPLMVVAAGRGGKTWGYNYDYGGGRYTTISLGSDYHAAQRRRSAEIAEAATDLLNGVSMVGNDA